MGAVEMGVFSQEAIASDLFFVGALGDRHMRLARDEAFDMGNAHTVSS
jgi:hypothetical protein